MFLVRDEWRLVASILFFKVWGFIKPFVIPVAWFFLWFFCHLGFWRFFVFVSCKRGFWILKA